MKDYRFGQFLKDVAEYKLHDTPMSPRLQQHQLEVNAAAGLNEAVPGEGGFLVSKDHSLVLLEKTQAASRLVPRCTTITVRRGASGISLPGVDEKSRVTGSRLGGVRVYRKNEAATATASFPKFMAREIDLEDLIGYCPITANLLQDVTALDVIVPQLFAREFGFRLDDEILNGTGAGQCLGILNSDACIVVPKETGQNADTVSLENVTKMDARFAESTAEGGVWIASREVKPQLRKLGSNAYQEGVDQLGKPWRVLLDHPVLFVDQAAVLGDKGDLTLADLSEYLVVDDGGINDTLSLVVNYTMNEGAFRFVYRVNGQPAWSRPVQPYKGADTLSAFVTLAARE